MLNMIHAPDLNSQMECSTIRQEIAPLVDTVVLISVTFLTNSTLLETKSTPQRKLQQSCQRSRVQGGQGR